MMSDKLTLRRAVRLQRRALNGASAQRAGEFLADPFFLTFPPFSRARFIAGYLSLPGELPPEPLMRRYHASGRRLALPAWIPTLGDYRFVEWTPGEPLVEGPCHVLQPQVLRIVEATDLDTVLVPGLAFDRFGGRVGFGGGWYDRLLAACRPSAHFCGLAFEWQLFPEVPTESHDIRMDFLFVPGPAPFRTAKSRLSTKSP